MIKGNVYESCHFRQLHQIKVYYNYVIAHSQFVRDDSSAFNWPIVSPSEKVLNI